MPPPFESGAILPARLDHRNAQIAATQCRNQLDLTPPVQVVTPALRRALGGPSPIEARLLAAAANDDGNKSILYQHSILCQTSFPYRDPGSNVRLWERRNGQVHLEIEAGRAMHPTQQKIVDIGLPFGPKPRIILMHLNRLAILTQSPTIDVGRSLTHFVERVLRFSSHGRNIRTVKEQLTRLSASSIRMGFAHNGHAITVNSAIVKAFELWMPKDDMQRVFWPTTISLSLDYFNNLIEHAVPVDGAHIAALSHSALALDIYNWLTQRLHRIPVERPQTISWLSLHEQFGQGYAPERIFNFRRAFRTALREVLTVYSSARIEDDEAKRSRRHYHHGHAIWRTDPLRGLKLYHSPPPVKTVLNA
jgi:hypothetical protein